MANVILAIVSGLLILGGTIGAVLPFLPGLPVSLAGLILYAWVTGFHTVSVTGIVVFSILTLATFILDIFAPALGAKGYKSSAAGVWGSMIGGVLGVFILGPIGVFVGPFLGGFIGEYLANPDHTHAFKAAWGAFVGMMIGTLFKLVVGIAMFGYFAYEIIRSL